MPKTKKIVEDENLKPIEISEEDDDKVLPLPTEDEELADEDSDEEEDEEEPTEEVDSF